MDVSLTAILKQFKDKKVIVWGDLILDEYIYTTTGRISREAPVLVTEFESNEFRLGGAGNVVMNIKRQAELKTSDYFTSDLLKTVNIFMLT